jgi:hypothetical protein
MIFLGLEMWIRIWLTRNDEPSRAYWRLGDQGLGLISECKYGVAGII